MNKTQLMAAAVAATLLMAGCNQDENPTATQNQRALNVTGGIRALTRAHDAAWEANDAIGIFMLADATTTISEEAENRKYLTPTGNGNFSPATTPTDETIYFPITGQTDFVAYYPWQAIAASEGKYLYAVDVATQAAQRAIDLMAADKVSGKDKDDTAVAFQFTHKLVKVALTEIKAGDGLTATDLQGLTVTLTNQQTQATYDVVTGGEVVVNTTVPAPDVALLVAPNSQSAEAIVLPAASTAGMELVFTLTGGDVYRWALSNATQSSTFVAGSKYSYKITVSKKGLNVTSSITDWVQGNGADGEDGTAE